MRRLPLVFLAMVLLGLTVWFAYGFLVTLGNVTSTPVTAWTEDHQADCAVVLTGGPRRIKDGLEQLYLKRVRKLVISGVYSKTSLNDIFPEIHFYGDLDSDDIILEKRSLTTYGNAQQSLVLLRALSCRDVVLITSRLHMYRAYKVFRHYFPDDILIQQRATVGRRYRHSWGMATMETIKTMFYDFWMY